MPAKRLPWYKVWSEHLEHPKICDLSDAEYRTWQYVLAKGSQQPVRWYFASLGHAAKVTGRPLRQVKALLDCGLLEEGKTPMTEGIWVHNAKKWQDKYPSDYTANPADFLPQDSLKAAVNAAGTLPESLYKKQRGDTEAEGEGEGDRSIEVSKETSHPRKAREPRASKADFDRFWAAYPRNTGSKANSLKLWERLTPEDGEAAIVGARNYATCRKVAEGFVKQAETWLRGRYWETWQQPEPGSAQAEMDEEESEKWLKNLIAEKYSGQRLAS